MGGAEGGTSAYSGPLLYVLITLIVFCISIRIKREEVRSGESSAVRVRGRVRSGRCALTFRRDGLVSGRGELVEAVHTHTYTHTWRNARP